MNVVERWKARGRESLRSLSLFMLADVSRRSRGDSCQSLAVVAIALTVSVAGFAWSCLVRSWCVEAGTCVARTGLHDGMSQCSFTTVVPLVSDLLHHNTTLGLSFDSLTRGLCGAGERLHMSSISGTATCMLLRPYPDALDSELMNPNASSDHQKACGAWIGGGGPPDYLAFVDGAERTQAIRHAEAQVYGGARIATTNLGKFYASCQRTTQAGSAAVRSAGELAYAHLVQSAAVDDVDDVASALTALGVLVGHYCDAPVLFGWEASASGYATSARRGAAYTPYALADALDIVREDGVVQALAEAANAWVNANALSSRSATSAELMVVLRGATRRTSAEDASANLKLYGETPHLNGFMHLIERNASVALDPLPLARAYLRGVAAMCTFSFESLVATAGYTARGSGTAAGSWIRQANSERALGGALGALKAPLGHEPLFEIEDGAEQKASTVTISQLVGGLEGSDHEACLSLTRKLFPDDIDALHFELLISPTLYERMRTVVAAMRAGVAAVLRDYAPIQNSLSDAESVANDVEAVSIRIPGAPRGTWAGTSRPVPRIRLDSADSVFVMAAKQARTVYLDRQGALAYDATQMCEEPAAYESLTQTAYILTHTRCSYYLLGLSFRPWADEGYDDTSLAARFGWVIAHELSHSNLNTPYEPHVDTLLSRYPHSSTRDEAFADTLASLGVLRSGLVSDREMLCQHVSQSWCARVPDGYYESGGQNSHPRARTRPLLEPQSQPNTALQPAQAYHHPPPH